MSEGRGVVLVGLPGSGKTTVGACLARHLDRPFVDLDQVVIETTGRTPAEIFAQEGEAAFRAIETALVERVCATAGAVIAAGGGTVIDPIARWRLWDYGTTVWLDAAVEALEDRLAEEADRRPLLAGDLSGRLVELERERTAFYRAADVRVASDRSVEAVALEVARIADQTPHDLQGGRRLFDADPVRRHPVGPERARVVLGRDLDAELVAGALGTLTAGTKPSLVADRTAARALPALIEALPHERRLDLEAGEAAKRLATLETILEWLSAHGAERGDPVIALGGGTLGDLVGFAAAVYLRGVPLVHIPTTWLAQADSAIGGKVAVDLAAAKNAVGATWPAWAVIGDVAALRSLPVERLRDGLAECLKMGLIGDPTLWKLAERHGAAVLTDEVLRYALLERAVRLKLDVVDRDPFESGPRRTLNLGHTIGHALEVESGYRLPHGAAVALGLRAVVSMACGRGAAADLPERIDGVMAATGFELRRSFDRQLVKAALLTDKKRSRGRQRWILPMDVGRVVEVDDVSAAELDRALDEISTEAH